MSDEEAGKGWKVGAIPAQAGRRVMITGANSGIGYYTALELARKGAQVVLACRDRGRGEAAIARIRAEIPSADVDLVLLDLAALDSVHEVATQELERDQPLHLLINNAGVYAPKRRLTTVDGFELQFGTNVLGHFLLTALLLPKLTRAKDSRVVTIASIAHKRARLNFDDLQSEKSYSPSGSYGQSKLADLMFAFELERRLRASGSTTKSIAAHPGVANSNLFLVGQFNPVELAVRRGMSAAIGTLLNTEAAGAVPTLFAATAPEARGGGYYGPQGLAEMRGGDVGAAKVYPQAKDEVAAARLWAECERMTGVNLL